MAFYIQHEFFLFGKESQTFSKDYFYEWEDGLGGTPSRIFMNFQITSSDIEGEEIGNALFDLMKNHFFHDLERDPGNRFEDVLKEINHFVANKEESLSMSLVPFLNVSIAAITGDSLFLSQRGDAEVYLIRKRYVSVLSEGLSDPKDRSELFSNIANGSLSSGDALLFSTRRLLRYVTKSDLGRFFTIEFTLSQALEAIKGMLSLDSNESIDLLAIRVGEPIHLAVIEGTDEDLKAPRSFPFRLDPLKDRLIQWKSFVAQFLSKYKKASTSAKVSIEEVELTKEVPVASVESDSDRVSLFKEWRTLKRDKILLLLVVSVLILLVGIYVVRNQGQKQQYIDELEAKLQTVEANLNTAQTTGSYDKEAAKILLDEAQQIALDVLNSGYLRGKASEYLGRIDQQRDQIDNVSRIEAPKVFLDFSVQDPSTNALGMLAMGDRRYVYTHNKLYEIILDKIQEPLLIDENEVVIDAVYYEDNQSLLFLTKSNRIIEFKEGQFSFVDTEDGAWHAAVDLEVYNNRIYLLDSGQKQIWRYSRQRNGFGGADAYVSDETIGLGDAVSFSIDGSVFILKEDGSVIKLYGGEKEEFRISKAPTTDLSGATQIDAEFERFQVFVLDPAGNRIMVYNKDAKSGYLVYNRQFILDDVEPLHDIFVDKTANRFYVVGGAKVYEVSY